MSFLIVTPSRNQLELLKLCIKSVADQTGVRVHHHVQDGASTDGTASFLQEYQALYPKGGEYSFSFESTSDAGMYDAINKGWRQWVHSYEIVAYLNCDEQYLLSTLRHVVKIFESSKKTDVCFGHVLVIDSNGELICRRDVVKPNRYHVRIAHLPVFTAATFIRARTILAHHLFFDTKYRVIGDAEWVLRMLDLGVETQVVNRYLSTFVSGKDNLALSSEGHREHEILKRHAPAIAKRLDWPIKIHHRLRKAIIGAYFPKSVEYHIYQPNLERRTRFQVKNATNVWRERMGRDSGK